MQALQGEAYRQLIFVAFDVGSSFTQRDQACHCRRWIACEVEEEEGQQGICKDKHEEDTMHPDPGRRSQSCETDVEEDDGEFGETRCHVQQNSINMTQLRYAQASFDASSDWYLRVQTSSIVHK